MYMCIIVLYKYTKSLKMYGHLSGNTHVQKKKIPMGISWQSVANKGRHIRIYYKISNTDKALTLSIKKEM